MTNELMTTNNDNILGGLDGSFTAAYCSLIGNDPKTKAMVMHVAQNPDGRINEMLNQEIAVKDIYAEVATLASGEKVPRVILITPEGKSYQATSYGVLHSLEKMFSIFGKPTYEEPVVVIPKKTKSKNGDVIFLDVAI